MAAAAPGGQQRADLPAVAQRRAHARRRPHHPGRLDQPLPVARPGRPAAVDPRGRGLQLPLADGGGRVVHQVARSGPSSSSAAAPARTCGARSTPTSSSAPSAGSRTSSTPAPGAPPWCRGWRSGAWASTTSTAWSRSRRSSPPTRRRSRPTTRSTRPSSACTRPPRASTPSSTTDAPILRSSSPAVLGLAAVGCSDDGGDDDADRGVRPRPRRPRRPTIGRDAARDTYEVSETRRTWVDTTRAHRGPRRPAGAPGAHASTS